MVSSPVEGPVVYDMVSITHIDAGSYFMPLYSSWVSDPGGRSWVPCSSESSLNSFLGRVVLEDLFR